MRKILSLGLCCYAVLGVAADTVLKLYRPFGEVTEQAVLTIKQELKGMCSQHSQLMIRPDAWRCHAAGKVFDPCFGKTANSNEVLCPQSPWEGASVKIKLEQGLVLEQHQPIDMSRNFPWAVELLNGEYCLAIDEKLTYDSMPVHYRCGKDDLLFGYLQRCKTVWSMLEKRLME